MRKAEERQTKDVLRLVKLALVEWEIASDGKITFEDFTYAANCTDCTFDVEYDGLLAIPTIGLFGVANGVMEKAMQNRMQDTLEVIRQIESSDNILLELTDDNFIEDPEDPEDTRILVDSWGTPIGVIFPGRYYADTSEFESAEDESGDLTIRDQAEDGLGSCMNKEPIFVSAGPDRTWGYRFQSNLGPGGDDIAKALWEASLDNIYSYDPFVVEAAR